MIKQMFCIHIEAGIVKCKLMFPYKPGCHNFCRTALNLSTGHQIISVQSINFDVLDGYVMEFQNLDLIIYQHYGTFLMLKNES